jgi:hypothetical protein
MILTTSTFSSLLKKHLPIPRQPDANRRGKMPAHDAFTPCYKESLVIIQDAIKIYLAQPVYALIPTA